MLSERKQTYCCPVNTTISISTQRQRQRDLCPLGSKKLTLESGSETSQYSLSLVSKGGVHTEQNDVLSVFVCLCMFVHVSVSVCVCVCEFHSTPSYLSGLGSPAGLLNSTDLLLQPEVGLLQMTDLLDQPADVLQVAQARA